LDSRFNGSDGWFVERGGLRLPDMIFAHWRIVNLLFLA
jgi:hypothetical protein